MDVFYRRTKMESNEHIRLMKGFFFLIYTYKQERKIILNRMNITSTYQIQTNHRHKNYFINYIINII